MSQTFLGQSVGISSVCQVKQVSKSNRPRIDCCEGTHIHCKSFPAKAGSPLKVEKILAFSSVLTSGCRFTRFQAKVVTLLHQGNQTLPLKSPTEVQWELCKITSCSVTSEAVELQGSCLTRRTAIDVQTMIGRTLCSSWLMNISWIFFSKTIV